MSDAHQSLADGSGVPMDPPKSAIATLFRETATDLERRTTESEDGIRSIIRQLRTRADQIDESVKHWHEQRLWANNLAPELAAHDERHAAEVERLAAELLYGWDPTKQGAFEPHHLHWLSIAAWLHDWGHMGGVVTDLTDTSESNPPRYFTNSAEVRALHGRISQQWLSEIWEPIHKVDKAVAGPAGLLCAHHQRWTDSGYPRNDQATENASENDEPQKRSCAKKTIWKREKREVLEEYDIPDQKLYPAWNNLMANLKITTVEASSMEDESPRKLEEIKADLEAVEGELKKVEFQRDRYSAASKEIEKPELNQELSASIREAKDERDTTLRKLKETWSNLKSEESLIEDYTRFKVLLLLLRVADAADFGRHRAAMSLESRRTTWVSYVLREGLRYEKWGNVSKKSRENFIEVCKVAAERADQGLLDLISKGVVKIGGDDISGVDKDFCQYIVDYIGFIQKQEAHFERHVEVKTVMFRFDSPSAEDRLKVLVTPYRQSATENLNDGIHHIVDRAIWNELIELGFPEKRGPSGEQNRPDVAKDLLAVYGRDLSRYTVVIDESEQGDKQKELPVPPVDLGSAIHMAAQSKPKDARVLDGLTQSQSDSGQSRGTSRTLR